MNVQPAKPAEPDPRTAQFYVDCLRLLDQAEVPYVVGGGFAMALQGESFIDILYNSGNGLCPVDDEWLTNAQEVEVLGYPSRIVPPEEQLWTKAFVQDRDRYDGADVAHLILAQGARFDWQRLLRRFRGHER